MNTEIDEFNGTQNGERGGLIPMGSGLGTHPPSDLTRSSRLPLLGARGHPSLLAIDY